ncbi:MAG: AIR synthase-related protein [Wujia sp.]
MEKGSINELVLTRSVTKHIKKINKALEMGTGVGHDYARVHISKCQDRFKPDRNMETDTAANNFPHITDVASGTDTSIIITEGVSSEPELAWVKAMNNFYVSGGKPYAVRIVALLSDDTKESVIKEYMNCFNRLAEKEKVQIAGGHTQLNSCYREPSFVVTVNGISGEYRPDRRGIAVGSEIIMSGYTGMLGTDLIIREKKEALIARFSKGYVEETMPWNNCYSIRRAAELAAGQTGDTRVLYMHDISCGGVYGALWQLGSYIGKGISVGHYSIPIRQETIEYCEFFGLNPYMLEGTGAFLMVVAPGQGKKLVDVLTRENIFAKVIGHVENNNERMVFLGEAISVKTMDKGSPHEAIFFKDDKDRFIERRCLSPVKGDEIYKVL